MHRAGLIHIQNSYVPVYERAAHVRLYQSSVIPSVFRTAEYARAIIAAVNGSLDLDDDVDAAVAASLTRSQYLYIPGMAFTVLLEEHVLRSRLVDDAAMSAQLGQLLTAMNLPSVTLGVILTGAPDRHRRVGESFAMFDEHLVEIELATARIRITQPADAAVYGDVFADLWKLATQGREARRLITTAIEALD